MVENGLAATRLEWSHSPLRGNFTSQPQPQTLWVSRLVTPSEW